ncbi:cell division protein FtsL [Phenylobacterium montanum]|uniref:Cell division protein n=1 Tax=Phenylobacterium montanum TaxID=2823693 RepID=A0A975FYG2_9CAUL|nr:cell division protein [Caulobacter sp. S6]QUD87740.1 cell division protein [Caulobacter sp. S6]
MNPFSLLNRRVRGFLVIELVATALLTVTVLAVYLAKTGAGDKRDDIVRVEQQIDAETAQIRLLRAEVAAEERPDRLEALASQYLGMQPVTAKHEIDAEALADIAQLGRAAADAKLKVAAATPHVAPVAAPAPAAAPTLQHAAFVTGGEPAAKAQR